MGDNGEFWLPAFRWFFPKHKPPDKRQGMSGEDKAKLRADRKRQRQARKR